jgi:DNA polymerase-3 subunit gamma/tau
MSYLVLARKYRPQTFSEVVKQEHVSLTLSHAIVSNRVAHAILLSGPRGTGKTTVARILAKAMNCVQGPTDTPCNVCQSCMEITASNAVDVFEIDGASNNGVDHIRDLRDNIKYMPAHSLFKIYIIDEVHMLSVAAFNALLKTLEEPPAHVIFIFATTEPNKIPATILSRCQRHDFRRIATEALKAHMEFICQKEEVSITSESLYLIANEAGGSMRDALSILDQVMAAGKAAIPDDLVLTALGAVDRKQVFALGSAILQGNIQELLVLIDTLFERGADFKKLYADLIDHFRNLMVVKAAKDFRKLVNLPAHELNTIREQAASYPAPYVHQIFTLLFREAFVIKNATHPRLALEMVVFKLIDIKPVLPIEELVNQLEALRKEILAVGPINFPDESLKDKQVDAVIEQPDLEEPTQQKLPLSASNYHVYKAGDTLAQTWRNIGSRIAREHQALGAVLENCALEKLSENSLVISVKGNAFFLEIIQREKNIHALQGAVNTYFGQEMELVINGKMPVESVDATEKKNRMTSQQEALDHPLITEALEIFNAKILEVKLL